MFVLLHSGIGYRTDLDNSTTPNKQVSLDNRELKSNLVISLYGQIKGRILALYHLCIYLEVYMLYIDVE